MIFPKLRIEFTLFLQSDQKPREYLFSLARKRFNVTFFKSIPKFIENVFVNVCGIFLFQI